MNFNQLMKQAQLMQKKVNKINKEYEEKEKEFESQNGLIKGIVTGKMEIKNLTIDPELLSIDNKEILEDMLTVTLNEAVKKANEKLPNFKHIKSFKIMDEDFERTTTNKVKRFGKNVEDDEGKEK